MNYKLILTGSSRSLARHTLSLVTAALVAAGSAFLPGCAEKEAPVIPSQKKKDDLQKDLENPYGAPTKASKGTRSRRDR